MPADDATGSRAAKGGMRYPDPGTEPHDFPDDTDATPDRAATRMIAVSIVNEAVDECLRTAAVKRTWGEIIVKALEDEGMLR